MGGKYTFRWSCLLWLVEQGRGDGLDHQYGRKMTIFWFDWGGGAWLEVLMWPLPGFDRSWLHLRRCSGFVILLVSHPSGRKTRGGSRKCGIVRLAYRDISTGQVRVGGDGWVWKHMTACLRLQGVLGAISMFHRTPIILPLSRDIHPLTNQPTFWFLCHLKRVTIIITTVNSREEREM